MRTTIPLDAERQPFRLVTVRGEGPQPGVDLDRTSALIVADDEAAHGGHARGAGGVIQPTSTS